MSRLMHFTLGPVQGFVGEARRLRDFWAGSFLLSWLAGHAMVALAGAGGKVLFPQVADDPLFEALSGKGGAPHVGSLPNRFKAEVSAVQGNPGEICADAVKGAWKRLADAVWTQFVARCAPLGDGTKDIWERQVAGFWEIAWVMGDDPGDGSDGAWLERRKNWRNHWPATPEAGDKCRMMGYWQEVSGHSRLGGRARQEDFWKALQERVGLLNLRDDERLCAIALIKRLFPLLDNIEAVIGFRPGAGNFSVKNWPSTSYIAALPWLKELAGDAHKEARENYAKAAAENLGKGYMGETETRLYGLPETGLFNFDGYLLHEDGIRAWPEDGLKEGGAREALLGALQDLRKASSTAAPSEFYALLVMDGDRIGARLREDEGKVRKGLADFTRRVVEYFSPGNAAQGALVYAGGDDVLAMLPVDSAIAAAHELRGEYGAAFGEDAHFTLSAAIVFAHYKVPLRRVMEEAHRQLDDTAKKANGRDSLALAVLKPGGVACEWASCWKGDGAEPGRDLNDLARAMARDPEFSAGFFHALREHYAPLFDDLAGAEAVRAFPARMGDPGLMEALVRAEYARSGKAGKDADVARLMRISQPLTGADGTRRRAERFSFDAGLMVRFLAGQIREGAP